MKTYGATLQKQIKKTKNKRMFTTSSCLFYLFFDTKNPFFHSSPACHSKIVNMDALVETMHRTLYLRDNPLLQKTHIRYNEIDEAEMLSLPSSETYTVYAPDVSSLHTATTFLTRGPEEDKRISARQLLNSTPVLVESARAFFSLIRSTPAITKQALSMFASEFVDVRSLRRMYHALKLNQ